MLVDKVMMVGDVGVENDAASAQHEPPYQALCDKKIEGVVDAGARNRRKGLFDFSPHLIRRWVLAGAKNILRYGESLRGGPDAARIKDSGKIRSCETHWSRLSLIIDTVNLARP